VGHPSLTLAEKILFAHLRPVPGFEGPPTRQKTYLQLAPDRVAMQDASAQMAVLQFMLSGRDQTAVPTSIHCDHLIAAQSGAAEDLNLAKVTNKEIFDFLESAARKYAIAFWKPGSGMGLDILYLNYIGIIHQIVLENYASPGALMLGTDSHTPNAGGADAVDAMADLPGSCNVPKCLESSWLDLFKGGLHLRMKGGTGHIIEYFGPGVTTLSCTGMATICNMGAEVGATTSIFPFTESMRRYLEATGRGVLAEVCSRVAQTYLTADPGCHYDRVLEIDLTQLEPHINGPFTPDLATPLSQFATAVRKTIGPKKFEWDMSRASAVAQQALDKDICLPNHTQFLITPGSEQVRATITRDGQAEALTKLGGTVLANACGPCIGQWKRNDVASDAPNSIISSFNRNFRARNDGSAATLNFLASPEIVTALSLAGRLTFNPATDLLPNKHGNLVRLDPPPACADLPSAGFTQGDVGYRPETASPNPSASITICPDSERLQLLQPFPAWDGEELELRVLLKVQGKCTTDHISAAGKWLKYKGHLENLANNTLIGATSAGTGKVNCVTNHLTNELETIPEAARCYKRNNVPWAIITDFNYGEGSAREHAAMQPRYLGCRLIIARSFARIHETNLKKQGVLALTFADANDYHKVQEGDVIATINLTSLAPSKPLEIRISRPDETFVLSLNHTLSPAQISWFKAGSALNALAHTNNT
ncbi:aconitate hydratase, partial [Massospora cicadina]